MEQYWIGGRGLVGIIIASIMGKAGVIIESQDDNSMGCGRSLLPMSFTRVNWGRVCQIYSVSFLPTDKSSFQYHMKPLL